MSREVYTSKTVEDVAFIDEPKGVSWLTAYSFRLDGDPSYEHAQEGGTTCECCNRHGHFPVSTKVLVGKKGTALAVGDMFVLSANLAASSPADVNPEIIEYLEPVSDEEIE